MKTLALATIMTLTPFGLMVCNQSENEAENVKQTIQTYFAALNKSDVKTISTVYAKDGRFMAPGFPAFSGATSIKNAYTKIFGQIALDVNLKIHEVKVNGNTATAFTESKGTVTIKANGAVNKENNKELFVLSKEKGKWYIQQYAFNKI